MNEFIKIIKERYISLAVVPVVLITVWFLYMNFRGVDLLEPEVPFTDNEAVHFPSIRQLVYFLWFVVMLLHLWFFLVRCYRQRCAEAFAYFMMRVIAISLAFYINISLYPEFTGKPENFQKEKRFYMNEVRNHNYRPRDGLGKLIHLHTSYSATYEDGLPCQYVYDESDTLPNPVNDHRFLGIEEYSNEVCKTPLKKITKIEPNFYRVCFDYKHQECTEIKKINPDKD